MRCSLYSRLLSIFEAAANELSVASIGFPVGAFHDALFGVARCQNLNGFLPRRFRIPPGLYQADRHRSSCIEAKVNEVMDAGAILIVIGQNSSCGAGASSSTTRNVSLRWRPTRSVIGWPEMKRSGHEVNLAAPR